MSIFQLPLYDVLFPNIFCYMDIWDVWILRTVCRDFCHICWKFYKNACKSLDINLTNCSTPDVAHDKILTARKISKVCTQLESFVIKVSNISRSCNIEQELNSLLTLVAKGPSEISRLHLAGFTISVTSPNCQLLELLSRGFSNVSEMTLDNIKCCGGDVSTLWKHCVERDTLRNFHLVNLTLSRSCLLQVAHSNPNLKHFCVAYCYPLTSDSLTEVFRHCSHLESVDLRCVNAVTDRTLHVLAEYCTQLKHLFIGGCSISDQAVQTLERRGVRTDIEVKQKSVYKVLGQI